MVRNIDATDKIMGRLAVEISILLRGKNDSSFNPAKMLVNKIIVRNVDKMRVSGKKTENKLYRRHSGFHGGLKEEKLKDLWLRDSRLALKHAIMGMLPKNKLRDRFMKNLTLIRNEK